MNALLPSSCHPRHAAPRAAAAALLVACILAVPPTQARVIFDMATHVPSLRIEGGTGFDDFGAPMATGDVNGDGIQDLIVADPPAINSTNSQAGRVYVYLGGPTFFATARRAASTANVVIRSSRNSAIRGPAGTPATGDVNADGIDDIVIGSTTAVLNCGSNCGGTWVVLGRSTWPATIDLETQALWTFQGTGFRFGVAALLDIDGDSLDDVLIRQPDATTPSGLMAGRVLAYQAASLSAGARIDTAVTAPYRDILGEAANARQVGLRDADLDDAGATELAVQSSALGVARAFELGANLPAGPMIDLASNASLASLVEPDATQRTTFLGREDLDGDGLADEIINSSAGDTLGRSDNGAVGVRRAAPPLAMGTSRTMGLSVSDWVASGAIDAGNGTGLLIADVSGDDLSDVLFRHDSDTDLTTPRALILPVGRQSCGSGVTNVDLATDPNVLAWIPRGVVEFFASSAAIADFDGDGRSDIAFGIPDGDGVASGDRRGVVIIERGRVDWDADGLDNSADCAAFDASAGALAPTPLLLASGDSPTALTWPDAPTVDRWHVLSGTIALLWSERGFDSAAILARDLGVPAWDDARALPAADVRPGYWYLVLPENSCGFADLGESSAADALQSRLCDLLP